MEAMPVWGVATGEGLTIDDHSLVSRVPSKSLIGPDRQSEAISCHFILRETGAPSPFLPIHTPQKSGSSDRGSKIPEQLAIRMLGRFPILGGVWVDHQLHRVSPAQPWCCQIGSRILGTKRQSDSANCLTAIHPVDGTMQLREAGDALKVTRFASDSGRVVVKVDIKP